MAAAEPARLPALLPRRQEAGGCLLCSGPKRPPVGFLPLGGEDGKINTWAFKRCLLQKISQHRKGHRPQRRLLQEQTCMDDKVLWRPSNSNPSDKQLHSQGLGSQPLHSSLRAPVLCPPCSWTLSRGAEQRGPGGSGEGSEEVGRDEGTGGGRQGGGKEGEKLSESSSLK